MSRKRYTTKKKLCFAEKEMKKKSKAIGNVKIIF